MHEETSSFDELFKEVLKAPIYDLVRQTPLDFAKCCSQVIGHEVFLKREDLQDIFSFKIRGAYNKIKQLKAKEKLAGVICVSAGNHGQGVALAGKVLGVDVTVVMPRTTPKIKIDAVRSFGAQVILHGDSYSDAELYCEKLIEKRPLIYIHPFDDPLVIAGQGTVAKEIYSDLPELDYVFVPVGGGGLLAGIAIYLKALVPHVKIIGVEPRDSDGMYQSLKHGSVVTLTETGIFADGVAVKTVGSKTFEIVKALADDWILVSTDEICSAIEYVYLDTRTILEPAGALSVAGAKSYFSRARNEASTKKVVCINSGANMNFQRMQFVAERVLTGDNREALFAIELLEKPGALRKFCLDILDSKSITEFNYRFSGSQKAAIFLGIGKQSIHDRHDIQDQLSRKGYVWNDLTEDDLAKDHIRHMVGGGQTLVDERLFHFRFPERPGALIDFLTQIGDWNISLFHYRSQGADYGKVLIGLQVPEEQDEMFSKNLENLDYSYREMTSNVGYRLFLRSEGLK